MAKSQGEMIVEELRRQTELIDAIRAHLRTQNDELKVHGRQLYRIRWQTFWVAIPFAFLCVGMALWVLLWIVGISML